MTLLIGCIILGLVGLFVLAMKDIIADTKKTNKRNDFKESLLKGNETIYVFLDTRYNSNIPHSGKPIAVCLKKSEIFDTEEFLKKSPLGSDFIRVEVPILTFNKN